MDTKKKSANESGDSIGASKITSETNHSRIRKGTKLYSVIEHLVNGNKLHRFQAERICHDHVLNSTISGFQRDYKIPVERELIAVPGYAGSRVNVANYWLDTKAREAAKKLLEAA